MYRPNFTITPKILNHIAEISASREIVLNAPILPKWEIKLRKEAILKMAHHSTSIEGNRLTLDEVSRLLRGEEIPSWEKDKKEVLGYVKGLEFIDDLGVSSMDLWELVLVMEDEFDLEVPDEDLEKIVTVQDAIDFIESHAEKE